MKVSLFATFMVFVWACSPVLEEERHAAKQDESLLRSPAIAHVKSLFEALRSTSVAREMDYLNSFFWLSRSAASLDACFQYLRGNATWESPAELSTGCDAYGWSLLGEGVQKRLLQDAELWETYLKDVVVARDHSDLVGQEVAQKGRYTPQNGRVLLAELYGSPEELEGIHWGWNEAERFLNRPLADDELWLELDTFGVYLKLSLRRDRQSALRSSDLMEGVKKHLKSLAISAFIKAEVVTQREEGWKRFSQQRDELLHIYFRDASSLQAFASSYKGEHPEHKLLLSIDVDLSKISRLREELGYSDFFAPECLDTPTHKRFKWLTYRGWLAAILCQSLRERRFILENPNPACHALEPTPIAITRLMEGERFAIAAKHPDLLPLHVIPQPQ